MAASNWLCASRKRVYWLTLKVVVDPSCVVDKWFLPGSADETVENVAGCAGQSDHRQLDTTYPQGRQSDEHAHDRGQ